jgi:hypothetical protein
MIVRLLSVGASIKTYFFASLIILNFIFSIVFIGAVAFNGIKNSSAINSGASGGKPASELPGKVMVSLANVE